MLLFPFSIDNNSDQSTSEDDNIGRIVLKATKEGIIVINRSGKITYVNDALCDMLERDAKEILEKSLLDFITDASRKTFVQNWDDRCSGLDERKTYEIVFIAQSGKKVFTSISSMPIISKPGAYNGSVIMVSNNTEQAQAEQLFQTAFQCGPYPMAIYSFEGIVIDANTKFCENLGYSREEVIGRHALELNVIEDDDKLLALKSLMLEKGSIRDFRVIARRRDGKERIGLFNADVIYIQGKPFVLSSICDITDWAAAEEENRLAKLRFLQLFQDNPCPMALYDSNENLIDVNLACIEMTGYSREELIGKDTRLLGIHSCPEDVTTVREIMQKQGRVQNFPAKIMNKSREIKDIVLNCSLIKIQGETYVVSTMLDVTLSKRLELEVARLDRLNLVGQMAASLGHEIRNPLTTVRGYLQLMHLQKANPEREHQFQAMIDELDRANLIITEFLALAKNRVTDLKNISLVSIVEAVRPLLEANANEKDRNIEFELKDVPSFKVDEKEIRQVILNLFNNAVDATPRGGIIRISTYTRGGYVLSVENDGDPIPADVIEKLGTPFFSTKEQGTGLGLAVCYSIAARHRATIDVSSDEKGTRFAVVFPAE